ncbi:MAG: hypothetical protein JO257_16210 [Deltaproteobacteria bacterium]|nr:hypothetical protein [Deltaproteobacteria bacterium]
MTKQDKDEAKRILALLADAAEHEQTAEEAEQELIADGVNVTGFLARVQQAVQQKQKEERLSWHKEARHNADAFSQTQDVSALFATMTHAQLVAEAQKYAAQLHFKNFDEATDEDLRTQLADLARLGELAKKR